MPFGKIPAFEDGHIVLFESRAISRYVLRKYGGGGLLLEGDIAESAAVDAWVEAEAHQYHPAVAPIVRQCLIEPLIGGARDQRVVDENVGRLRAVLEVYEARLSRSAYLAGDSLSLADLAHVGFTRYLMATEYAALVEERPSVRAWWERLAAWPAVRKVIALMPVDFGIKSPPRLHIPIPVQPHRLGMAPAAADVAAVLGDDLLREVFVRLPSPEDLLRAASACKPFLRAARSDPFLRRFRRLHPSSCPRLLGCLILQPGRFNTPRLFPSCPTSSSSSAAAADRGGDFGFSFLPGGWQLGRGGWRFLDCRNGRLLLENRASRELAVADPIARSCVALPAPPTERAVGYGLVADSSEFRVVCVSRDASSSPLRALVLSSGELSWADVAGLPCHHGLAAPRAMQANRSLYWKLEDGDRLVAFSTVTMGFSVLELPPSLQQLSFDVIEKGEEDGNALHLLTMRGSCIEVWAGAANGAGGNGMTWGRVEKTVRFHELQVRMMETSVASYQHELDVVGVAAGVVFVRLSDHLFSIDLETMKLTMLREDCWLALIYPYTIVWPPSVLHPVGQGQGA
ncbi:hypothetical protein ACP70R_048449 [Stipagrostis hirtigluma subsp. patula]